MILLAKQIVLKNGKHVVLKSPSPDDAQNILDHLKIVLAESYKSLNHPAGYWDQMPVEEERKILLDISASDRKFMIAAFADDRIVAVLGCFGMNSEFFRHNGRIGMGIEKAYQGQGLGEALLRYAVEAATENHFHRLDLTVRTFNQSAIALYEKLNFRRVGILKQVAFIDGDYRDEFMYELLLEAAPECD
jgi:RimJ/RimL family protein N-acetyltransferase